MRVTFAILMVILWGCDSSFDAGPGGGNPNPNPGDPWLIPTNLVFEATGRDAIPALNNPPLIEAQAAGYLFDPELIIGYYDGQTAIAYPHHILDWHEIINQTLNGDLLTITYCPLTGTGIGWPQNIEGFETEFGVSGLLYNNNLIAFDRNTGSHWAQMTSTSVNGPKIGTEIPTFQLVETRWSTWVAMFPETKVVGRDTGWDRPYGSYPYGDFRSDHDDLFYPLTTDDGRLQRKERVHGIVVNGNAKVYRFPSFGENNTLILDTFEDQELVVVGNEDSNFIVSFSSTLDDGTKPIFTVINEGAAILADDAGNKWDIFGNHVAGDLQKPLIPTRSFVGYWFAWGAFYPRPEIYDF